MGRQKYPKRKLPRRQRGKLLKSVKPHESEPERTGTELQNDDDHESLAWDSLDEISLAPTPSGTEYFPSPDEMEVTRRLSCLNFSMIPCPANAMILEPGHALVDCPDRASINATRPDAVPMDFNTMDLLPSLSDRDVTCRANTQSRKRPSRHKPNKRIKKSRQSLTPRELSSTTSHKHNSTSQPHPQSLCVSFVRPTQKDPLFSRTRSFRRPRRLRSHLEEDTLLGFYSDTSAVCDIDVHTHERMDVMCDDTPTSECGVEGGGEELNDSDISESTTSDSGCEGDDEESSVEGPLSRQGQKSPGWLEKENPSSDDEKLSQILHNAFPLMSESGQKQFHNHLYHDLSEFKHPGRFGVCARGPRKKRCKPAQLTNSLTLMEINQQMIKFVQNASENELKFNLVSRALCRTISSLANVYNLDCYIEQKRRLPVASPLLRKSLLTRLASRKEIEPILRNHGRESPTVLFRDTRGRMDTYTYGFGVKPRPLDAVGGDMPPLNESNIGNQMLQNMGWRPGTGLGRHGDGMQIPVRAELRPKKAGLGY